MAQLYSLVPLPVGIFKGMDPVTRMVVGALWDRYKLSMINYERSDGGEFYDPVDEAVYVIFTQQELAELIGVSERTIRRSLDILKSDNLVWWRKATYRGANRYFLHHGITEQLRSASIRSI